MVPSKSSHLQHHQNSNICHNSSMIFISNRTIGLFVWCKDSYISKKIHNPGGGGKPWVETLNPKKPSMRTLGLSTLCLFLVILSRMTTAWQNMFQLCKWSTTLLYTNHILHTEMGKQLCSFLKPKLSSKEKFGTWFIPNKNEVFAWRGGGLFQVPPKEIDFFKWN